MDTTFPFGLAPSLQFYLVVYVLTLVVHVFFMTYVLAGSMYLAWAALFPGSGDAPNSSRPLAALLRDWMPFVLSAAITAGVAPLLFVQIVYRQEFYTANLLLGWRWLVVIPVLVVGFYLLYLVKSRVVAGWSFAQRALLAVGTAGSFLFVAFCWTANHLLSVQSESWPSAYESGDVIASMGALVLRLSIWVSGAFPTMAVLAGWQLIYYRRKSHHADQAEAGGATSSTDDTSVTAAGLNGRGAPAEASSLGSNGSSGSRGDSAVSGEVTGGISGVDSDSELSRLSIMSLAGLGVAVLAAFAYIAVLSSEMRSVVLGGAGMAWLGALVVGLALQILGWILQFRRRCFCSMHLSLVTCGCLITLVAAGFLREILRLRQVGPENVVANTQAAADVGGFAVFLLFTVLNTGLIIYCVKLTYGKSDSATEPSAARVS